MKRLCQVSAIGLTSEAIAAVSKAGCRMLPSAFASSARRLAGISLKWDLDCLSAASLMRCSTNLGFDSSEVATSEAR